MSDEADAIRGLGCGCVLGTILVAILVSAFVGMVWAVKLVWNHLPWRTTVAKCCLNLRSVVALMAPALGCGNGHG